MHMHCRELGPTHGTPERKYSPSHTHTHCQAREALVCATPRHSAPRSATQRPSRATPPDWLLAAAAPPPAARAALARSAPARRPVQGSPAAPHPPRYQSRALPKEGGGTRLENPKQLTPRTPHVPHATPSRTERNAQRTPLHAADELGLHSRRVSSQQRGAAGHSATPRVDWIGGRVEAESRPLAARFDAGGAGRDQAPSRGVGGS